MSLQTKVINRLPVFNKSKAISRVMRNASIGLALMAVIHVSLTDHAHAGRNIIRDAEIEALIRDYATPIFRAAGLSPGSIEVILVNDPAINAFVTDYNRMFIFTGLLMEADTPNEVIGVIAHETGHIIGGHLASLRQEMRRASATQIITMLLGAAAAVAAGSTGSDQGVSAGVGIMQGGRQIATRNFLAYRRIQEAAADQAAMTYLNRTRQSAKGMNRVFNKLANQMMVTLKYADPYALSHPTPRNRMSLLERRAKSSPYYDEKDPPELQLRHDMMKAKLYGFTRGKGSVLRKFKSSNKSLAARYARAISVYRTSGIQRAEREIDQLIRAQPKNPYFHELKGQALLEAGLADKAIAPLQKALSLAPNAGLIRIMLAQALLASKRKGANDQAIKHLRKALLREQHNSEPFRLLAQAYAGKGNIALAQLNSAERFLRQGNTSLAYTQAKRAQKKLRKGSPSWLRASDILALKQLNGKRKR